MRKHYEVQGYFTVSFNKTIDATSRNDANIQLSKAFIQYCESLSREDLLTLFGTSAFAASSTFNKKRKKND